MALVRKTLRYGVLKEKTPNIECSYKIDRIHS
jgi:hypothetical protein